MYQTAHKDFETRTSRSLAFGPLCLEFAMDPTFEVIMSLLAGLQKYVGCKFLEYIQATAVMSEVAQVINTYSPEHMGWLTCS